MNSWTNSPFPIWDFWPNAVLRAAFVSIMLKRWYVNIFLPLRSRC